jgi:uncharacterized protein (TIGR04141 family)
LRLPLGGIPSSRPIGHGPPTLGQSDRPRLTLRAASGNGLTLLDRRLIRIDGQSAIEACDLFSSEGHFIHVKHRKGGSSPLSHLFGQALVSAECLVREPEFRTKLRGRDPDPHTLINLKCAVL